MLLDYRNERTTTIIYMYKLLKENNYVSQKSDINEILLKNSAANCIIKQKVRLEEEKHAGTGK